MRYEEFKRRIDKMAASASPAARTRFALDTIKLLRVSVEKEIQTELSDQERQALSALLTGIETESPEVLANILEDLVDSMTCDPVRAIEFHPQITELLCAIENWISYCRSQDPGMIAEIAINMVNAVDFNIGGDTKTYSIKNMLGAPQMEAEFERQKRLLLPD